MKVQYSFDFCFPPEKEKKKHCSLDAFCCWAGTVPSVYQGFLTKTAVNKVNESIACDAATKIGGLKDAPRFHNCEANCGVMTDAGNTFHILHVYPLLM